MTAKKGSARSIKSTSLLLGAFFVGGGGMFAFANVALPTMFSANFEDHGTASPAEALGEHVEEDPKVVHLETPQQMKAIYMSQCVVGTPSFRESLVKLIDETELNSIVIDIKDFTGKISFRTDNPLLAHAVSDQCGAADMKEFIETLHEKNIYVIGRITVFQDPFYSALHPDQAVQSSKGGVWKDYKGLAFVDVGARAFWDYIIALSEESYALGFDELNFDYVRFPSDGPMTEAVFSHSLNKSKPEALEEFFKYITDSLRPRGAVLSVDLFGMTATNKDDLGIGQVLERALPYFDYIYPMVYPSHYPSGWNNFANVNEHTYEIIKISMDTAFARAQATTTTVQSFAYEPIASTSPQLYLKPSYSKEKIRPWLQSFNYPVTYTPTMVSNQIEATKDAGIESWLFWDAANKYSALSQVLSPENLELCLSCE